MSDKRRSLRGEKTVSLCLPLCLCCFLRLDPIFPFLFAVSLDFEILPRVDERYQPYNRDVKGEEEEKKSAIKAALFFSFFEPKISFLS